MQWLLEVCQQNSYAELSPKDNSYHLAICRLVSGYGRPILAGTGKDDTHTSDGRQVTKWIEVRPISKCDGHTAVSFLKDIILRYGYPHSIITDNGTNFSKGPFSRFCMEKGIRLDIALVAHLEANGQVERANALVLSGIKPRHIEPLERTPGCC